MKKPDMTEESPPPLHAGEAAIRANAPYEREVEVGPGSWVLEVWLPEREQGFDNEHRLIGRTTGNFVLRRLQVVFKLKSKEDGQLLDEEVVKVKQTKQRETLEFVAFAPATVSLQFSTMAILFPLHFEYIIRPYDAEKDSFSSIDWLEESFTRIPVDDKLKIASVLKKAATKGWKPLKGSCAMEYDNSLGVEEMKRSSEHKTKAKELGLIRPFLLLVSMHPRRRIAWAVSLGVRLHESPHFGDAHWEALHILKCTRKGFVSRVSKTFLETLNPLARDIDWYQALFRVVFVLLKSDTMKEQIGTIPDELAAQLEKGRIPKPESMSFAAQPGKMMNSLENAFLRMVLAAGNQLPFREAVDKLSASGSISLERRYTIDDLQTAASEIVRADPDLNKQLESLLKHGFDADSDNAAILVLCMLRREVEQVEVDSNAEGNLKWDKRWGSQVETVDKQFQQEVESKVKREKRVMGVVTTGATVIPVVLGALAISPAVLVTLMLCRNALKVAFPQLPATVAGFITGLLMQRLWLALADVGIEEYYE